MFGWVAVLINHRMMAISGHMIELIVESDAALCSELSVISLLQFIGSLWLAGHSKCTQWNTWGGFQRFHSLNDGNFQHLKIFFLWWQKFLSIFVLYFFSVYRCQTLYSTSILELNRDMCRRVWFLGLDWIFTSTAILDHTNHLVAAMTIKKELFSKH